jgi:hypothetical protein
MWKEAVVANSRYCAGVFLEVLGKTTETLFRKVGVPVEIRIEHIPNKSHERHHYANPLGETLLSFLVFRDPVSTG